MGGGIYAYLQDNTQLSITGNLISYNSLVSTEGSCRGAGINLNSYDNAVFNVMGNVIEGNSANSPPGGLGSLDLAGNSRISNGTVDIGAYEYLPKAMPYVPLLLLDD